MPAIRVRYQTFEFGKTDIHVRTLRDNQEFSDDFNVAQKLGISSATWPLFGIIWPSGELLAHIMFIHEITGKRILEVGCGIGLASLVLNRRDADITATDYHPEAGGFLAKNTDLNNDAEIPFVRTGWEDENSGLGKFDLIIGSDLLYERDHIELLSQFIEKHASPQCEVIITDPGRAQHARFGKAMQELGYEHTPPQPEEITYLTKPFKGRVLRFTR